MKVDAVRLRQAMHNLLKNALEAIGDQRKPQIVVATEIAREGDNAWVDIIVSDNGSGLPEGFGELWFEPYTSSKARGTGLGLAVVKKIAEEHGGSVRAMQREGGGASFILRLPLGGDGGRSDH
ncbi:MAG: GHKL domain-containing protein [Xanthomonadales bacterium]|nr:GHKL domain-containing protein [Xanthomonadales bacterium]